MTWSDLKLKELVFEINNHKGYGESKRFYALKEEIKNKLGKSEWERLLRKAKFMAAKEYDN